MARRALGLRARGVWRQAFEINGRPTTEPGLPARSFSPPPSPQISPTSSAELASPEKPQCKKKPPRETGAALPNAYALEPIP